MWKSIACTAAMIAIASPGASFAQVLHLTTPTDTVNLAPFSTGPLTQVTYEARVFCCGAPLGLVFQEQANALEDKAFACGTERLAATAWNPAFLTALFTPVGAGLSQGAWHHVAFVYDGQEERIYRDGQQLASRLRSGIVSDTPTSRITLGGFLPSSGPLRNGFVGFVDYVRISSVSRYQGASFSVPSTPFTVDGATLLYFEFNEPPSSTHITDLASGVTGALGVGFPAATMPRLVSQASCALGVNYCTAVSNSTGVPARIGATGSRYVGFNDVRLAASSLPTSSAIFFLNSRTQGLTNQPGGSLGVLCLGGSIGRYVAPGQVGNSGSTGSYQLPLDLHAMPTPNALVSALPGQTWHFQAWYRDSIGGMARSNFTDAVSIQFN